MIQKWHHYCWSSGYFSRKLTKGGKRGRICLFSSLQTSKLCKQQNMQKLKMLKDFQLASHIAKLGLVQSTHCTSYMIPNVAIAKPSPNPSLDVPYFRGEHHPPPTTMSISKCADKPFQTKHKYLEQLCDQRGPCHTTCPTSSPQQFTGGAYRENLNQGLGLLECAHQGPACRNQQQTWNNIPASGSEVRRILQNHF